MKWTNIHHLSQLSTKNDKSEGMANISLQRAMVFSKEVINLKNLVAHH